MHSDMHLSVQSREMYKVMSGVLSIPFLLEDDEGLQGFDTNTSFIM